MNNGQTERGPIPDFFTDETTLSPPRHLSARCVLSSVASGVVT